MHLLLRWTFWGSSQLSPFASGSILSLNIAWATSSNARTSDVGGGVFVTHDGLEVPHNEDLFFDGATPHDGEAIPQQRHKICVCSGFRFQG